ncbi:hypothetical protein JGC18_25475, partial [Salmonella enterica subsp. enterica serovar Typhimurium]|nr:hypothetical protein [Salmonella enterica subsp. enterica serovar Typhimurium]
VENGAFQANSLEGFRDAYVAAVKGLLNDPVTVCTPEKKGASGWQAGELEEAK